MGGLKKVDRDKEKNTKSRRDMVVHPVKEKSDTWSQKKNTIHFNANVAPSLWKSHKNVKLHFSNRSGKDLFFYHLEYSDYCFHLDCYIYNVLIDTFFCFL